MKFTVEREKFLKALQRVNNIVSTRSMLPILSNVLITAENNQLKLTATDLEIRIDTVVDAAVEVAGVTTLPAKKLLALTSCFAGKEVEITVNENHHAQINCGSSRFKLLGLPADDFPEMIAFEPLREIKLAESLCRRMLNMVSYAVSIEDSRKTLTGVLFAVSERGVTFVATDSKRLAIQESNLEFLEGTPGDAIVPIKAVNELKRMLEGENPLSIKIGEKLCRMESANFTMTTKLIDGNYPNYRKVIPQDFSATVEINAAQLRAKIETVGLALPDMSGCVTLTFADNKLTLNASSTEVGEGCDMVDVEYAGDPIEVTFNPKFFDDPLKICSVDKVQVSFNAADPLNPVALEGDPGFLYVIMPIRKH
jgi:DNA polymerase-3 subunit beta